MPQADQSVILLVEDLEDDILLIRRAFAAAKLRNPLQIVRDGEEAMAYLLGTAKYSNRDEYPLPDLVLLDLKMPRMDGFGLLRWIRNQPEFKAMCVIVLTSSEDIYDVNRAYELGANSFLVKPLEFINYPSILHTLQSFWLKHSRKPQLTRPPDRPKSGSNPHLLSLL